MFEAGCEYLSFGLESGSDKVLKLMRKGIKTEWASEVLRLTHKNKILASVNILIGFPGEEEEDFQDTLTFLDRNKTYLTSVSTGATLGIGKGSYLYQFPEKYDVKLNDDGSVNYHPELGWTTLDGRNTQPIRNDRLNRLKQFLKENNIKH